MTRVLVVDDDTDVLRLLQIKLGGAGYAFSRARSVQEALAAVAEGPDIVLTELALPDDGDGLLLGRLALSVPLVLALSARADDASIRAALGAGAADFIAKPFSPEGLIERLRVNLIRAGLDAPAKAQEERRGPQ